MSVSSQSHICNCGFGQYKDQSCNGEAGDWQLFPHPLPPVMATLSVSAPASRSSFEEALKMSCYVLTVAHCGPNLTLQCLEHFWQMVMRRVSPKKHRTFPLSLGIGHFPGNSLRLPHQGSPNSQSVATSLPFDES